MPLDPTTLEECRRLAREAQENKGPGTWGRMKRYDVANRTLGMLAPALIAEVDDSRALLRELEWCVERDIPGIPGGPRVQAECPVCGGSKPPGGSHDRLYGHEAGCRLAAMVGSTAFVQEPKE